ncbi:MAG: GatB/YqeY domain-containing protein [Alphaproteobacteria bacterium]|nr:GatB/YqeY domain-containing protein [Alphaproteobacteria bacterium]
MLRDRLKDALKEAMKAKDEVCLRTLRLILAALKDRDIAARPGGNSDGINEDEILSMLQSMIKQRHDSIEMYKQGGRDDLAAGEAAEVDIITQFLPQQLSEDEVAAAVVAVISATGAESIKDMGKVMSALKSTYAGQMDFGKAGQIVKATLAS